MIQCKDRINSQKNAWFDQIIVILIYNIQIKLKGELNGSRYLFLYSLFAINDKNVKNFLVEANKHNKIEYQFVKATSCKSGPYNKSYVLAPTGKVILKQKSNDGSIGEICSN